MAYESLSAKVEQLCSFFGIGTAMLASLLNLTQGCLEEAILPQPDSILRFSPARLQEAALRIDGLHVVADVFARKGVSGRIGINLLVEPLELVEPQGGAPEKETLLFKIVDQGLGAEELRTWAGRAVTALDHFRHGGGSGDGG